MIRRKRISSLLSNFDTSQSKELSNVDRLVVLLCPPPLHSTWKQKCSHLALTICIHIYNNEVNHTVYDLQWSLTSIKGSTMGAADNFYGSYHQAILMHYYVTASIVDGFVLLILIFCQKKYLCIIYWYSALFIVYYHRLEASDTYTC